MKYLISACIVALGVILGSFLEAKGVKDPALFFFLGVVCVCIAIEVSN
jgi:hypothetical protein